MLRTPGSPAGPEEAGLWAPEQQVRAWVSGARCALCIFLEWGRKWVSSRPACPRAGMGDKDEPPGSTSAFPDTKTFHLDAQRGPGLCPRLPVVKP